MQIDEMWILVGVPKDKLQECCEWAFGKLYYNEPMIHLMHMWNKRHGAKLFTLKKQDPMGAAIGAIGKAYCITVLGLKDPRVKNDKAS